jgi:hypothetical protein
VCLWLQCVGGVIGQGPEGGALWGAMRDLLSCGE